MLSRLRIRNLATIEDLEVHLQKGFSILTGETGAGKSIIIDGLRLVLGEKSSPDFIRTGEKEASVEAVFSLPPSVRQIADIPLSDENEVFIQRQVSDQGTGRIYINGVLVPVRKLKEYAGHLVDIYGQNDHIFLLHLENHLEFLDAYCEARSLREEAGLAAQKLKGLVKQKTELEAKERERAQRLDFLSYQVNEIEKAQLKPGEEDTLAAERNILKNAERISNLVEKALDLASGQDDSALPQLARLQNVLNELGTYEATFESAQETINGLSIALRELMDFLVRFRERQTSAPEKLEALEERLSLIEKLKRKYGADSTGILLYFCQIKKELEMLSFSQERMTELQAEISTQFSVYEAKSRKLSELRTRGARELEKQVEKEIILLGMKKAKFRIQVQTSPPSLDRIEAVRESGTEDIEFLISPNPGEELRPLRKIASGGELSRVMLALKRSGAV
jgi:DNA repair protein RecN (Recombination protein N)